MKEMSEDPKISINSLEENEDFLTTDKKGLSEDLINEPKRYSVNKKSSSFSKYCSKIFPCLKKVDTTSRRIVYFNDENLNITNWSNEEENNKYNIVTFLPVVLFNQFKQFGNFFYLIMSITRTKSRIFIYLYFSFSICCLCFYG